MRDQSVDEARHRMAFTICAPDSGEQLLAASCWRPACESSLRVQLASPAINDPQCAYPSATTKISLSRRLCSTLAIGRTMCSGLIHLSKRAYSLVPVNAHPNKIVCSPSTIRVIIRLDLQLRSDHPPHCPPHSRPYQNRSPAALQLPLRLRCPSSSNSNK